MKKEGIKLGLGLVFMQIVFWGISMLECDDKVTREKILNVGVIFVAIMLCCTLYVNIGELYQSMRNLHNGLMMLCISVSFGITNGLATNKLLIYVICWLVACVTGVIIFVWLMKRQKVHNQAKTKKNTIGFTLGASSAGVLSGKYLLKRIGQKGAYVIYTIACIVLEYIFATLSVLLILEYMKTRREK